MHCCFIFLFKIGINPFIRLELFTALTDPLFTAIALLHQAELPGTAHLAARASL